MLTSIARLLASRVRSMLRPLPPAFSFFFRIGGPILGLLVAATPFASAQTLDLVGPETPTLMLEAFKVSGDRLFGSDVEGADLRDRYDSQHIEDTGSFTLNEFFETLPGAGRDEEVLVLIDGEPAYIDPSSLPLGMIEEVEVSREGSMPEYGAQSSGRVINIRLKKDYRGGEAGLKFDGSFAGGGGEQLSTRLSTSVVRGKLRLLFGINASKRYALDATDRPFSSNQDHTVWGGSDLRLTWGSPAVIRAASGSLNGLFDVEGNPVSVALVPEGQSGENLSASDFLPAGNEASGQRRFDTAAYRQLMSPSRQLGSTFSASYPIFGHKLRASLSGSFSQNQSHRIGAPPVSPASSKTLVPAAYNPFGQDVEVGFVHTEFGSTRQTSRSERAQAGLTFNGKISAWSWQGGMAYRRDDSAQTATDLDHDRLAEALRSSDPATRFNPFGDPAAGPVNTHLYPSLAFTRTSDTTRDNTRFDFSANGPLVQTWAGPVTLALRGGYQMDERVRISRGAPGAQSPESRYESHARNASASVNLPLTSRKNAIPFLNRLEARLSARYSTQDDGSDGRGNDIGLTWSPVRSLLFRARHSEQSSMPSRDVSDRRETLVQETILDPRRDNTATEAQIIVRDLAQFEREKSTRQSFGVSLEPPFASGLRFSGTYFSREREDLIQRRFSAQDIVNNEAAFASRIVRAAPTAEDIALGRPGAIVSIDTTPGNSGRSETRSFDLNLEYAPPPTAFGRIRFSTTAERLLEDRRELAPGVLFVHDGGSRTDRPEWEFRATTSWSYRAWSTSLRIDHTSAIDAGPGGEDTPERTIVTLNAGWRLKQAFRSKRAAQYRIGFGIGNLFDEQPARADTLSGYRGGSPLGRTFHCTFSASI